MSKKNIPQQKSGESPRVIPTTSKLSSSNDAGAKQAVLPQTPLLFGKTNYIWMLAGIVLVGLGLLLMIGGAQPENQWNANEVYSFRRTALAPIVILIGLGLEVVAIFKKNN